MAWNRSARRALTAASGTTLAAALAACDGGSDGTPAANQDSTAVTPASATKTVLMVGVDGATYAHSCSAACRALARWR